MVEGFEVGPDTDRRVRWNGVGPGYYHTLGIPLLAGREFTESDVQLERNWQLDHPEMPRVVIVNEAFARKFNLGRDPIGKRMGRRGLNREIVGLVKDFPGTGHMSPARRSSSTCGTPSRRYTPYPPERGRGPSPSTRAPHCRPPRCFGRSPR